MSFARALRKVTGKANVRAYELSGTSGVDYNHIRRLLSGESQRPVRDTIIRLGQALLDLSGDITLDHVDQLLVAAGKGPLRRERIVIDPS